jgi:hypothetical protein
LGILVEKKAVRDRLGFKSARSKLVDGGRVRTNALAVIGGNVDHIIQALASVTAGPEEH